jgi:hypothetical protein
LGENPPKIDICEFLDRSIHIIHNHSLLIMLVAQSWHDLHPQEQQMDLVLRTHRGEQFQWVKQTPEIGGKPPIAPLWEDVHIPTYEKVTELLSEGGYVDVLSEGGYGGCPPN